MTKIDRRILIIVAVVVLLHAAFYLVPVIPQSPLVEPALVAEATMLVTGARFVMDWQTRNEKTRAKVLSMHCDGKTLGEIVQAGIRPKKARKAIRKFGEVACGNAVPREG